MKRLYDCLLCGTMLLGAGCGPADDVEVQRLPSLAAASPEARAGLPEIGGVWRFAGWELAEDDSAGLERDLPGFGLLWLRTQKRDSLAGHYVVPGGRVPLFGEVRRDSVISLVALPAPGDGRFLAGRLRRDTLWVSLTSLPEPGSWPRDARAAFVRSQVAAAPFRRLRGAAPPPVPRDTAALAQVDSPAPPPELPTASPGASGTPSPTAPGRAATGQPPAATPAQPRPQAPPAERRPAVTPPEPEVSIPEPELPPVLGEPVVRDTAQD